MARTLIIDSIRAAGRTFKVNEELKINDKSDKCPNCSNRIELLQINKVVGNKKDQEFRRKIVKYINKLIKEKKGGPAELHIDTCLLKAHFISQTSTETSFLKDELVEQSSGPYYSKANVKTLWPSDYKEMKKTKTLDDYVSERPQKKLLNKVYGGSNGNNNISDGWKYRGRGLIQLTGKANYKNASKYLKQVFPDRYVDLETTPKKTGTIKYAVLTAIAFWEANKVYHVARDITKESGVPTVRKKINYYDRDNPRTRFYFENALKAFKVESCKK